MDDAGWALSLDNTLLEIPTGENKGSTLSVIISSNAVDGMIDNVAVTATSRTDNTVSGSASCAARASVPATVVRSVSVSISPTSKSGADNVTLTFTVTVNNTGDVADNYSLTVSDNASPSWSPNISPSSLTVSAGGSGTVTLSVKVPLNALKGRTDNITVRVTSQTDDTVYNSASCTASSTGPKPSGGISIWLIVVIVIVVIVVVIVIRVLTSASKFV